MPGATCPASRGRGRRLAGRRGQGRRNESRAHGDRAHAAAGPLEPPKGLADPRRELQDAAQQNQGVGHQPRLTVPWHHACVTCGMARRVVPARGSGTLMTERATANRDRDVGRRCRGPQRSTRGRRPPAVPASAPVADVIGRVAETDVTVLFRGERGTGKAARRPRHPRRLAPVATTLRQNRLRRRLVQLLETELFGCGARVAAGADRTPGPASSSPTTARCSWTTSASCPRRCRPGSSARWRSGFSRPARDDGARRRARDCLRRRTRISNGAVAEGRFREGLFFRLNVVCLTLPPLRQRRNELRELAAVLRQPVRRALQQAGSALSSDTLRAFADYSWPGNLQRTRSGRQAHRHARQRAHGRKELLATRTAEQPAGAEPERRRRAPDAGRSPRPEPDPPSR